MQVHPEAIPQITTKWSVVNSDVDLGACFTIETYKHKPKIVDFVDEGAKKNLTRC